MTENIVRNGVAHFVATNERTKNAVNPRNSFVDNEKSALADASMDATESQVNGRDTVAFEKSEPAASLDTPDYPRITDHYDTRAGFEPKKHIHDNLQKLHVDKPTDNGKFFESLHKVEDRISTLRQKQPKANRQSLGDGEQVVDNILYREKKNITSRFQSVHEGGERNVANLPVDEHTAEQASGLEIGDELRVDDSELLLNGELGAFDEDELRARVRRMQAKLTRVNQSLKDIEKHIDDGKNG